MELHELLKFAEEEVNRLNGFYKYEKGELKSHAVMKLAEETGECVGEALKHLGKQRKYKLDNMDKDELGREISDVIFVALIVANSFGIDIENSLKNKMDIIKGREN
jgi:NTP pyrophosphatase (non-canonical NTP hydrolase)